MTDVLPHGSILGTRVAPRRGSRVPDHRRGLHRGPRRRPPGRRAAADVRALADRPRPDHRDRHARRARRRPACVAVFTADDLGDPRRPAAAVADVPGGDGPAAARRATSSASSASRSPPCSPRSATRARTPPSWSTSTTSRCPPSSTRRTPLRDETAAVPRRRDERVLRRASRASRTTSSPTARSSSTQEIAEPARRRRAARGPRRRRGLGRRRPAHRCGSRTRARRARKRRAAPACSACRASRCGIITPDVGGAFGAKFGADAEHAARRAGSPGGSAGRSRWVETRSENMVAMTHGRAQVQTVTIGGDPRRPHHAPTGCTCCRTRGAYPKFGGLLPTLTLLMAPGVYDIDRRCETSFVSVVTNTTPVGAYRGAGRPEATAAIERAVDLFAAEIGMDPAEVRRRNLLPAFTEPLHEQGRRDLRLRRLPGRAGDGAGRRPTTPGCAPSRPRRRERGDARAAGHRPVGLRRDHRRRQRVRRRRRRTRPSRCTPTAAATILTGTSPHGQGHSTVWAMLASEELGIPIERITVRWGDTDLVPEGGGTGGSRSLQQGGAAVRQAAPRAGRAWRSERAADRARGRRRRPGRRHASSAGLARAPACPARASASPSSPPSRSGCSVRSVFSAPGATYPFGAHVAVVEVDVETGQGRAGAAGRARRRRRGHQPAASPRASGTAGWPRARRRRCSRRCSSTTTATRRRRPSPTTRSSRPPSCPASSWSPRETPTRYNPLGAKGIGEAGTIGVDAGGAERRRRRRRPPRRAARRHADHARCGSGGRWPPRAGSPPDENVPLSCVHAG